MLCCSAGVTLSEGEFAELYKVNDPTENCEEPEPKVANSCGDKVNLYQSKDIYIYEMEL